ncbi:hypothetical protein GOP47_0023311 [Adiantum capillus-veneris]|uniref:Uncharacterized protein n=1 Tax=Adiantum capillus-veneris TaxID=13818 RepID=A0A9D4U852_ADICA|nr:hypothetical protein GOP47_0023311 [Adiantum capillus-veneris]
MFAPNGVKHSHKLLLSASLRSACKWHGPHVPLIAASDGKLKRLKNLVKKTPKLRFLCESPKHSSHKVEGKIGKEVVLKEGILTKAASILVPALRFIRCAAKFVVDVSLPDIAPNIFEPYEALLKSLGDISSKRPSEIKQ